MMNTAGAPFTPGGKPSLVIFPALFTHFHSTTSLEWTDFTQSPPPLPLLVQMPPKKSLMGLRTDSPASPSDKSSSPFPPA
jgi:hypothetical protein